MFIKPFGTIVRDRREAQGVSQKALAELCGIASQRLSELELGQGQPTPAQCRALELVLGPIEGFIEPVGTTKTLRGNGRRCLSSNQLYEPPRDRATHVRFSTARRKYPEFVAQVMTSIQRRPDFPACQSVCHQLVAESAEEVLLILRLLLLGASPCHAAPDWMTRVPHRIIDPRSGTGVSHCPAACLAFPEEFFFFQVTLSSREWRHRVDVLRCQREACSVIEVDGFGHDAESDRRRERQIGLATTRLGVELLLDLNFDLRSAMASAVRPA